MNTNDFNTGQTIFLLTFLAAELPSGLISKKIGADRWIPTIMIGWSIVAGAQAFLKGKAGYYVIKALLGLLMGGFIPDISKFLFTVPFFVSRAPPKTTGTYTGQGYYSYPAHGVLAVPLSRAPPPRTFGLVSADSRMWYNSLMAHVFLQIK